MNPAPRPAIDELLDRALQAVNQGDRETATALAGQVLAVDRGNQDAEDLLAAPADGGEMRRLTIMFADLVDSTALSTRVEPEVYRTVVGSYRQQVTRIIDSYEGHLCSTKGDGLLAVFGHPKPHENDVHRAVLAGLDITRVTAKLSQQVRRRFDFDIAVRVGIHRGIVYLDLAQDDVYGLGANLTARVSGLAPPNTVAVSGVLEPLLHNRFELASRPPQSVKGIDAPVEHFTVVDERPVPTHTYTGPLVGREHELRSLRVRWDQAVAGTLPVSGLAFTGEPGIGKSRLASAAAEQAERSGGVVLSLFGSPFHTTVGLHPIRTLLESRCGITRLTPQTERLRLLEAELQDLGLHSDVMVPLLAPVLGIAEEHGYQRLPASGTRLYDQISDGIRDYLLACLGQRPGLLLAEDVHWFDPSSLDLLDTLLGAGVPTLLVVMTARPQAKLPGNGNTEVFELDALTAAQADELIGGLRPDLNPADRADIRRRCDGIPLYLEEVVAGAGRDPVTGPPARHVPDALYEPLFARLRASANAVPVAQAAAVIGRDVDRGLLHAVLDLRADDLDHVVAELEEAQVLHAVDDGHWRFRHELLREVAYELAPPSVRRALHGRVADALVEASRVGIPDWGVVAMHYAEAQRHGEAATAAQHAAADARRRGALTEARTHLTLALEQLDRLPAGSTRNHQEVNVRLYRGFLAAAATGHTSIEAAADFERCLELIGTDVSLPLYATLSALWSYYTARGDLTRATQLADSLRKRIDRMRASGHPVNEASFGTLAWLRGDFVEARNVLEETAAKLLDLAAPDIEARSFAPNDPIASTHTYVALTRFVQGDLVGAEAALDHTENRCAELSFPHGPFSLCYGRSLETWIRTEAGQLDRAAELAVELGALGRKYGFDEWVMVAATQQATVAALTALAEGADAAVLGVHAKTMTAFVEGWRAAELRVFLMCYDAVLARVLHALGRADDARRRIGTALCLAEDTGMHFYDAELLRVRAVVSDTAGTRRTGLREAAERARGQCAHIFEIRIAAEQFALTGGPAARAELSAALKHVPPDQTWPEVERARNLLA
ncbi:AAA family ATPase [Mycolicibacterium flavescens]|uniref:Guanylate cyclase n=1 Tax=Mycolicibacterium flavescens TaxID=1776 RepID=A0A1E3RLA6_MYCFV|nr:adenylate/guanylate cyclase domain-containing protein [Mycolicibacterium flavescens]MCV7281972.1 AAA family ATPase [Mycolicibacterium flavescens]ODQ90663.1 guanylate cyclase [Mycolicibacterium flavescens]